MKTTTSSYKLDTNAELAEGKQFEIAATAHAFQILSKNLYSDVPRAIVRELLCNGIDAHKKSRNNDPVELYLPVAAQPTLKIVDYGVGMTEDDINEVFTSFFTSTKQNSNREVGMLGLGCKTPFAYTDQFTIKTAKNGKLRTYLALKNEKGLPEIRKLDENNVSYHGTEIELPINDYDFEKFYKATYQTILFFKQLPNIARGKDELINQMRWDMSCSKDELWNTFVKSNAIINSRNEITTGPGSSPEEASIASIAKTISGLDLGVVMGGVYYAVEKDQLSEADEKLMYPAHGYNGRKIINVAIGDVEIQPSREALNYSEETKDLLKKRFTRSYDADVAKITKLTLRSKDEIASIRNVHRLLEVSKSSDTKVFDAVTKFGNLAKLEAGHSPFIATALLGVKPTATVTTAPFLTRTAIDADMHFGKDLMKLIASDAYRFAVVMPEKMIEAMNKKAIHDPIIKLSESVIERLNLVHDTDMVLVNPNGLNLIYAVRPDITSVEFDSLKPNKERKAAGPRTEHDELDFVSVHDGKGHTYEQLKELVKNGTYKKIAYELFTGEGRNESNGKTMWAEYALLDVLKTGITKKADATRIIDSNKGFASQHSTIRSQLDPFFDGTLQTKTNPTNGIMVVSLRWKTFIAYELWKDDDFVQIADHMIEYYHSLFAEVEAKSLTVTPKLKKWISFDRATTLRRRLDVLGADKSSVMCRALDLIIDDDGKGMDDASMSNFVTSFRKVAFKLISIAEKYNSVDYKPWTTEIEEISARISLHFKKLNANNVSVDLTTVSNAYPMLTLFRIDFVDADQLKKIADYVMLCDTK
jgi:hypothetical protein